MICVLQIEKKHTWWLVTNINVKFVMRVFRAKDGPSLVGEITVTIFAWYLVSARQYCVDNQKQDQGKDIRVALFVRIH